MSEKIVVGISGGVDSSVAALILKNKGYDVTGVFMKNWEEDDDEKYCSAAEDIKDAENICEKIGIPLKKINFASEYWDNVFEYFISEYKSGRTPNPDILCNKEIKFKVFADYAKTLNAKYIATGHYARKTTSLDGDCKLLRGLDESKDQSYFLYALSQEQLKYASFPIGDYQKSEIREIAKLNDLCTHNKKDSTGICFIGERKFKNFLKQYIPAQSGDIVDEHGNKIGRHDGLMYYTIGQRQGLGIGGVKNRPDEAWYAAKKDLQNNVLIAVQGHSHSLLLKKTLQAKSLTWLSGKPPSNSFICTAKTRYRQSDQICDVEIMQDDTMKVTFKDAQRAITPGQSVVLYDDEICLGGGIITN